MHGHTVALILHHPQCSYLKICHVLYLHALCRDTKGPRPFYQVYSLATFFLRAPLLGLWTKRLLDRRRRGCFSEKYELASATATSQMNTWECYVDIAAVEPLSQDLKTFLGCTFTGCTSSTPNPGLPSIPESFGLGNHSRRCLPAKKKCWRDSLGLKSTKFWTSFCSMTLESGSLKPDAEKMDDLGKPHFGKSSIQVPCHVVPYGINSMIRAPLKVTDFAS